MLRPLLLSVIGALGITSGLHAQSDSTIAIGFTTRLHSTILDEDRPVLVHLPPGYGNPNARYPVLYLHDGETHFNYAAGVVDYLAATGRAPAMIVIALPNTDRTRDLTPLARSDSAFLSLPDGGRQWIKFPGQGGASDFRRFLTEELAPWVEARYAAESYRILAGHSFGGLFAIDAALTHPESFNAYIAASPALWWDDRRLIDSAPALLGDGRLDGRFIFMSMGDEGPDMNVHVERLAEFFDARGSAGLTWGY